MAKSRELKRRIKAVGNIRRITKTMQMIATARYQAALKRAVAARPFSRKIAELVGEIAAAALATGQVSHPLLGTGAVAPASDAAPATDASEQPAATTGPKATLVLVITSNRGLCGGYNASILRLATTFLNDVQGPIELQVVGKKGSNFFRFVNRAVSEFHSQIPDTPTYELIEQLADRYIREFTTGKYAAIHVVYMGFISAARQAPRVSKLLPLESPASAPAAAATGAATPGVPPVAAATSAHTGAQAAVTYDYSPDPASLLAELLPVTCKLQLFQFFCEAVVGEQIARMVAMKAATDSAGKMGKDLSRKFNRARQAAITTELSEIIAGAASLE